jgi:hypothetical protein
MDKFKAIWKIIKSEHFYLITADKKLYCSEISSKKTEQPTISKMIALFWGTFWKGVYVCNVKNGEKYV